MLVRFMEGKLECEQPFIAEKELFAEILTMATAQPPEVVDYGAQVVQGRDTSGVGGLFSLALRREER